jgi:NAD(P)-dependent dehydrogenase (short-subunit alcohol dehydrogenase family)
MALNPRIGNWTGRVAWVIGASSGIGRATAELLHARGATVIVSARNTAALEQFAQAHPGSQALPVDVCNAPALEGVAAAIAARHERIAMIIYCAGHYAPMTARSFDLAQALRHQQVNYVGALNLLAAVLPQLLAQGRAGAGGHLSLVSSVAGYRGLPQAMAYGPTKAALINLAETLYFDLSPLGLGVSVINPGFVDTALTAQNDFRMPALISADEAAQEIVRGWERGAFEIHFPKRFTLWLKAFRGLSSGIYFNAVKRAIGL